MKTKLLRKLKRQIVVYERNGLYMVYDNRQCTGGVYNKTNWVDKNKAFEIRRDWILKEALRLREPKRIII